MIQSRCSYLNYQLQGRRGPAKKEHRNLPATSGNAFVHDTSQDKGRHQPVLVLPPTCSYISHIPPPWGDFSPESAEPSLGLHSNLAWKVLHELCLKPYNNSNHRVIVSRSCIGMSQQNTPNVAVFVSPTVPLTMTHKAKGLSV